MRHRDALVTAWPFPGPRLMPEMRRAEIEPRRRHCGSKRIVSHDPMATRFFLDLPRDLLPSDLNIAKPNHVRAADLVRACPRDSSVALANKLARIISAVMTTGEAFRTETFERA